MCSEVSFLKQKVIMIKSWLTVTVIYWKPVLKFKSHSFAIHSQVYKRTHDERKRYFFNKSACTSEIKSLKIHCGIPPFYYFHVLFFPCFFKTVSLFSPPTGAIPSEKPSSHVSPEAAGLSGPCSHQEGEQTPSSPVAPFFHCCVFSVPSEPASLVSVFPPAVGIFHAGLVEGHAWELRLAAHSI